MRFVKLLTRMNVEDKMKQINKFRTTLHRHYAAITWALLLTAFVIAMAFVNPITADFPLVAGVTEAPFVEMVPLALVLTFMAVHVLARDMDGLRPLAGRHRKTMNLVLLTAALLAMVFSPIAPWTMPLIDDVGMSTLVALELALLVTALAGTQILTRHGDPETRTGPPLRSAHVDQQPTSTLAFLLSVYQRVALQPIRKHAENGAQKLKVAAGRFLPSDSPGAVISA